MTIYRVDVAVALTRPIQSDGDAIVPVLVEADHYRQAEHIAHDIVFATLERRFSGIQMVVSTKGVLK